MSVRLRGAYSIVQNPRAPPATHRVEVEVDVRRRIPFVGALSATATHTRTRKSVASAFPTNLLALAAPADAPTKHPCAVAWDLRARGSLAARLAKPVPTRTSHAPATSGHVGADTAFLTATTGMLPAGGPFVRATATHATARADDATALT